MKIPTGALLGGAAAAVGGILLLARSPAGAKALPEGVQRWARELGLSPEQAQAVADANKGFGYEGAFTLDEIRARAVPTVPIAQQAKPSGIKRNVNSWEMLARAGELERKYAERDHVYFDTGVPVWIMSNDLSQSLRRARREDYHSSLWWPDNEFRRNGTADYGTRRAPLV